jgi:hypothetical protein
VAGHAPEARFELRSLNIVMAGTMPGMTRRKQKAGSNPGLFVLRVVIVREGGRSSTPRPFDSIADVGDYWMPAFAGMTVSYCAASSASSSAG